MCASGSASTSCAPPASGGHRVSLCQHVDWNHLHAKLGTGVTGLSQSRCKGTAAVGHDKPVVDFRPTLTYQARCRFLCDLLEVPRSDSHGWHEVCQHLLHTYDSMGHDYGACRRSPLMQVAWVSCCECLAGAAHDLSRPPVNRVRLLAILSCSCPLCVPLYCTQYMD